MSNVRQLTKRNVTFWCFLSNSPGVEGLLESANSIISPGRDRDRQKREKEGGRVEQVNQSSVEQ